MNPLFLQAIQERFPSLDEQTHQEIYKRVFMHMQEILKHEVYTNDIQGLAALNKAIESDPDPVKRSIDYTKTIQDKFSSMPQQEQIEIQKRLETELMRVMHELYKAYE